MVVIMKEKNDEDIVSHGIRGVVKTGMKVVKTTAMAGGLLAESFPILVGAILTKGICYVGSKLDENNVNNQNKLREKMDLLEKQVQELDAQINDLTEGIKHMKKHPQDFNGSAIEELEKELREVRSKRKDIKREIYQIKEEIKNAESGFIVKNLSKGDKEINKQLLKGVNQVKKTYKAFNEQGLVSGVTQLGTNLVSQVPGVGGAMKKAIKVGKKIYSGDNEGITDMIGKEVGKEVTGALGLGGVLKGMANETFTPALKKTINYFSGFFKETPQESISMSK